jgi:predicted Fe-Mo cluster-binding NifX family protein
MKIIIPLEEHNGPESKVSEHFGRAPFFAVVETATGSINIIDNGDLNHENGQDSPVESFASMGIGAVLCNGIGAGAASRLKALGIRIYMVELAPTLVDALERYESGSLMKFETRQACPGHEGL